MHRLIVGLPPIAEDARSVDHKDCDGLNNVRSNLRIGTQVNNSSNTRKAAGKSSRFKGVSFSKQRGSWRAEIRSNKTTYYLGRFKSETDAALAYDSAAKRLNADFARTNF